jgi:MoCo/4Fe-4S cofactor protein with predicted Tat translocation signal
MSSMSGRDYWRSLEELADSPEFAIAVEREMPGFAAVATVLERRRFLQLMAAAMALGGLSACGPESNPRQLLPYVEEPPGIIPGRSRYYATATSLEGYATGVLIAHQMARPIKVEGNPDHPASRGAASALMQASILGLYDPRRAQSIRGRGQFDSWESFVAALFDRRERLVASRGEGLRLLTGTVTSPSLAAQITQLRQQFPAMRWHQWEPIDRDAEAEACKRAFGQPFDTLYDLGQCDVILAVGSDLISGRPGHLAYAREFAARRRPTETGGTMSRVYAIESTPTLIGAKADHRLPMRPAEILAAMHWLAGTIGAGPQEWAQQQVREASWLDAAAKDLMHSRGRALVHVGREQPVEIHLLAIAINNALGSLGRTIRLIEPVAALPVLHRQSLNELAADMRAGSVDTLLMLDTNPAYTAPADLEFAAGLSRIPLSVSLALYADETAQASTWHIPAAHEYETWSDVRAFDGTITIQQPQVKRLYGGHSAQELLSLLQGNTQPDDYGLLRDYWKREAERQNRGDFEQFWHESVRIGIVENSAAAPATATPRSDLAGSLPPAGPERQGLELLFRPDDAVWDGRFADNAWLLEMPRPLTRLTWDNAALIAPATATRLGVSTEDVVEITVGSRKLKAPVFVLPGQASDCITLPLGFGRHAGALGVGVGFDAYWLRTSGGSWSSQATVSRTGERARLASVQGHDRVAGRDLIREGTLVEFQKSSRFLAQKKDEQSLYPAYAYPGRAWAMTIDLNFCIGCQACVIACQAENNIPTVGKEQVLDGRIMHWLRIDRYYKGSPASPKIAFEPMPCMQCENAPCEVVCPVHATVHDHEGLNLMVYNRCIGTRFCSNNCPYKVRRFNFFAYAHQEDRPAAAWNPDVSVRDRGVMEKCTYCIQRIRAAEIAADRDNRPVHDGEVVTACQQSCPTQAIVFGDRNDPQSVVARRKTDPLDYVLLDDLNTRPRTSYGALIRNPNPAIGREES